MPARRNFDPLARCDRPHWLVVSDMHHASLECTPIPPGADLKGAMHDAIARLATEGWEAESHGRYGFRFVARTGARRLVNLTTVDPQTAPGAGHAFLAGAGEP